MTALSTSLPDLDALRAVCPLSVAEGDSGWDAARATFNVVIDQRPVAVAVPTSAAEVSAAVGWAAEHGLRVVPQTTGHGAGPLGDLSDAVIVKLTEMRGVSIDAAARTARAEGGALWAEVIEAASEHGLAALHGSSPTVSVIGYSVSGGLSWYARKHGLQCNHLTAVEIVTADGRLLRATTHEHADLFWAVRGGGGNFGVVTAVEFELIEAPQVYAGALFFPWERAAEVLKTWHELLPGLPEEMTSIGRIMQIPPMPAIPEPLRGRGFAVVEATLLGDRMLGEELLAPLRELGPEIDTFAEQPPAGIAGLHMDPPEPVPHTMGHVLTTRLDDTAIEGIVDRVGAESGSALMGIELRHTGGAIARPGEGALASLPGELLMFTIGIPADPEVAQLIATQMGELREFLAPFEAGLYPSFVADPMSQAEVFGAEAFGRLQRVKESYDPRALMRGNHAIA